MNRAQLFDALSHLSPQDFERLLFAVKPPGGLIPSPEAPQIKRVKALLDWAKGSSGRGIDEVQDCFDRLQKGTLPEPELPMPNFQPYLESILSDEDYLGWQEVYTTTTVEGRKHVSQSKLSPRLKLRAEMVKLSKEEPENKGAKEQVEQWDVLTGLRQYAAEHVLLIGKPGSGKSTSLERLLWEESKNALQNPAAKIPVLVKLRRCTSTLEHLIQVFFSRHQLPLEITDIKHLLRQEKLLLLLDGLNELPEAFGTEVANFRDRHRKTTPMIVSTRDLAGGRTLGITKTLKMLPLTEPQMQEFVRGYLGEDGNRLFQQLKGDRLRKFAETPLLLWMLCRVFVQNGQVPANLGLAFREFTQLYDQGTEEQKAIQEDAPVDSRKQWPKLLRYLAFGMHNCESVDPRLLIPREEAEDMLTTCLQQEGRTNARENAERWLQDLLDYHLLQPVMQPNHLEHIEFRHQLIQEYYAAECLLRLLPELSDEQLKRDYLNLLKWTEPIALMLTLVNEDNQALRIVKLAIDDVDWILGANLAGNLQPKSQIQIIKEITRFSPASENLKVELLGFTRSNLVIPHLLPYLGRDDFDLQYTLNKALERINSEDLVAVLTKTVSDKNPMTRIASIAALTNTPSQEAVQALRKALRHESPETRWSAAEALGDVGSLEAEEDLILALSDPSPNVVRQAASALGKLASEKSVRLIFQKLQESSSIDGIYFAHALASIGGKKIITALIKLYLEGDRLDFIISAIEQAEIPQEAISIILEALNLEYTSAQISAILAVGALELKLAVPHLMVLAHSEDYEIQGAAIEALGKLKAFEAKDLLIEKLEDKNYWTVTKAAIAIGRLNAKEAIPKLKSLLYDKKYYVQEDILYALSLMNDMEAWNGILDMLEDENIHIRRIAISTLKSSNLEEVANDSRLLLILRFENNELTLADALEILGTSKFNSKFSVFESFLEHPDSIVRRGAINGLRISSERKAVSLLRDKVVCKLIDDSVFLDDDLAFVEAAYAIGEIGDSEDLPFLIQILKKTGKEYFLEAILKIQSRCKFYNYEVSQQGDSALTKNGKTIANTISIQTVEKLTIMSDTAPIFNQPNATIGVNYAAGGSQQDFTQHIHAPEQNFESLLTGYKHFIDELQQQNSHVTDETAIIQTIDIEARRIDTRWQNFLNLKRLWNGGKKAAIKVGEHFVESNPWGKGAIAFLEGVSEDMQ